MSENFKYLIFSFINFFVFFGFLFLILRKPISGFLLKRNEDYINESKKWSEAVLEALKSAQDMKSKTLNIQKDGEEYLESVRRETKEIGAVMLKQADDVARTIKLDSERMASAEKMSYSTRLKDDFITSLIKSAREDLSRDVDQKLAKGYLVDGSTKVKSGDIKRA